MVTYPATAMSSCERLRLMNPLRARRQKQHGRLLCPRRFIPFILIWSFPVYVGQILSISFSYLVIICGLDVLVGYPRFSRSVPFACVDKEKYTQPSCTSSWVVKVVRAMSDSKTT